MPTKVLICGATGFIGRNLAERLGRRRDLEVYGTHFRRLAATEVPIRWVRADLTDPGQVDRIVAGMDVVIQAAATTSGAKDIVNRPYIHVADNAIMNSVLLRAAYDHAVRHFVFFSCSVMYPALDRPIVEDDFRLDGGARIGEGIHPRYFGVGWTKVYIEQMCDFYGRQGRTRHTVIRHSNIYGPHDKYDLERSHVFGATVTKVMTSDTGRIVVWGEGRESRDLLHVDDLLDFVELALERQTEPFDLVNVGLGKAVSVRDLVAMIIAASGRDLKIEHDLSHPSLNQALCLDCTRARSRFGWQPRIPLEEGIRRTLDWYTASGPGGPGGGEPHGR